jgi:hypothetical protein
MAAGCAAMLMPTASAQSWVTFSNETASRLVADPAVGAIDTDEKDYAWGDFDHDGDIDLVCVRKQPFSTPGRRRNVLFMNEGLAQGHAINGVLVDRTQEYGTSTTDGGQGLLDLTNNRDVVAVDVNNDGWLDLVTAPTYGQGLPKTVSHPRVYCNRGESKGVWLGFRYEHNRTPDFGSAPNFCAVGAGDVTGDGLPDLYFVDYEGAGFESIFDDRLLINTGLGDFIDQTDVRINSAWSNSAFGTAANIADMNNDGKNDIIKSEDGPVKIIYNGSSTGFFTSMQTVFQGSGYFSSVSDLNGDGRMDIVVTDDSTDRYFVNKNLGVGGQSTFTNQVLSGSEGIGSSSRIADLDNDGKLDLVIADVDVNIPGCTRRTHIYRNTALSPNVLYAEPTAGTGCTNFNPPASCIIASIPANMLTGTFDVAVFDINGDGWKDLVIGRCSGTQVWMNVPPPPLCPGDINGSQGVDIDDLVMIISSWGATTGAADINHDHIVNIDDLVMVITAWGPCG